ncbi:MAG: bifunctional (p)ppGpp synthetase/guanosine-3',5'-bis(diphosphate) 3'-pyrophosphohydrolase [Bacteroidales bacterium]|nr:bifunctional (p)ppGpp synthetase/guanosine-3',5'-bis(diphosphate) 3'-pyrophosphohydrolase [Bacteroidales bacterium]
MYIVDEELERKEILSRYKKLISTVSDRATKEEKLMIRKAFTVARNAHAQARRRTGEPYIYHPLEVARIASADLGLGPTAIVCALLHDVVEDTEYTLEDIENIFNKKVAQIVDGLTKIQDIFDYDTQSIQSENFKKLIVTIGDDVRVILLKLCDRLHNMRTLDAMSEKKQLKIASETQFLYVPLAHRLGLYKFKSELEDLATKYINPKDYYTIADKLKDTEEDRKKFIADFCKPIREKLKEKGFDFTISYRVKSITSVLGKMEKKGVKFEEIYDIFAIRIILNTPQEVEKETCYSVYSLISGMYEQRADRFRDWLTKPKSNGYEALHTTVMSKQGKWVEIQIRSMRMDEIAEKGLAAHYKYKEVEEGALDENLDSWLSSIRDLLDNPTTSAIDFVNDFKMNIVTDEITVFTPKGKSISLTFGSSVLDFAFNIDVSLGLSCIGAKVNYKVVPIDYKLHNADQVEIITSSIARPEEKWLQYVRTPKAIQEIRKAIDSYKSMFYSVGEDKLREIFEHNKITFDQTNVEILRKYMGIESLTDLYYKVFNDEIDNYLVQSCFSKDEKNSSWIFLKNPLKTNKDSKNNTLSEQIREQIQENPEKLLMNQDIESLPYVTAKCCNPLPGDDIVGLIREGSIEVHRTSCKKAVDEMSKHGNHIIKAKWRENEKITFLAGIKIQGIDRKGLLQELARVISEIWNLNMRSLAMESSEGVFEGTMMVYISNADSLNSLMDNIRKIDGIESVKRM